jgi:hypothetical protein
MQRPRKRFYEEPWFKVWALPLALLAIYLLLQLMPGATVASWLVDAIAVMMMFLVTLVLASQFVLPVRTLRERRLAAERILAYVSSMHGPILFIRDGDLVGSLDELKRKGTGVILVDGSSAVVLERQRRFSRAEGPGIVFTKPGERLAATFDLRKQSRSLETQALTKDGIEIKASISVTFALDAGDQASPRETSDERDALGFARITPAFPFNPESAFKAYYGFAVTGEQTMLNWTELPALVATELFRDMISRNKLDELFQHDDPGSSPLSAMQIILTEQVQKAKLLSERGIKVYRVSIGAPELPSEVISQWLEAWAARWEKEKSIALSTAQADVEQLKLRARAEVKSEIRNRLRAYIKKNYEEKHGPLTDQQLAHYLAEDLNDLTSNPIARYITPTDTLRKLDNFRTWAEVPDQTAQPHIIGDKAPEDMSELVAEDIPQPDDSGALVQSNEATVQNNRSDDSKGSSGAAGGKE